jgi:hypothetical protein
MLPLNNHREITRGFGAPRGTDYTSQGTGPTLQPRKEPWKESEWRKRSQKKSATSLFVVYPDSRLISVVCYSLISC